MPKPAAWNASVTRAWNCAEELTPSVESSTVEHSVADMSICINTASDPPTWRLLAVPASRSATSSFAVLGRTAPGDALRACSEVPCSEAFPDAAARAGLFI
eukprot:5038310-Prymnesium_polylepis.1